MLGAYVTGYLTQSIIAGEVPSFPVERPCAGIVQAALDSTSASILAPISRSATANS